jgi:hypothetical protein
VSAVVRPQRPIVVCVPCRESGVDLPPARLDDGPLFISGGERSMYELATAAVVAGYEVELRGDINAAILATVTESAGTGPQLPKESRRPHNGEIVVFPEAYDLSRLAAVHLSGARGVIYALAPPGLFGWSFRSGWSQPDHSTVPVGQVGQPESFQAMFALGFSVWTNAHGIAEAAQMAGIPVTWLGTGTPVPFPSTRARTFDLAVVESNRWRSSSDQLAADLGEFSVLRIPARASTYTLCEDLAHARILLWPSRVEGMSRISREARAVGTVPVALDTNPFATKDDHGEGVVLVPDLASLRNEARRLLHRPEELVDLSARAVTSAKEQVNWGRFVARVDAAVGAVPVRPDGEARAEFGDLLAVRLAHRQGQVGNFEGVDEALEESESDMAAAQVRLQESLVALSTAHEELAAFRARRIVRLVDRLAAVRSRSAVGHPELKENDLDQS